MFKNLMVCLALLFAVGILANCSDNSSPDASQDANSQPENRAPQVDADPTPDTGTGGESQSTSPDGTVNSAPAGQ